jgi:hypothetical protein
MSDIQILPGKIIIKNVSNYFIVFKDDQIILEEKKDKYLSEKELLDQDLKYSLLKKCYINDKIFKCSKYKTFLIQLYKHISDDEIISISTMRIEKGNRYDSGFIYYEDLGFSVQGKDSKGTLTEIIHISKHYEINIEFEILLKNKKTIFYRSE